jgi:hypothetical protein
MKNIKIEIKWAIIFSVMGFVDGVRKLCGLHGKYIDYHLYLTNLFAIPAIIAMVMALKTKKIFYNGQMNYKQGLISGIILSIIIAVKSIDTMDNFLRHYTRILSKRNKTFEIGYFKTTAEAKPISITKTMRY